MKTCPRCNGKGWTYYKGHECRLCRGKKSVRSGVFMCQVKVKSQTVSHDHRGFMYQEFVHRCNRVGADSWRGGHYCWQHSPRDDYARRRAWRGRRAQPRRRRPPPAGPLAAWKRDQDKIKRALEEKR